MPNLKVLSIEQDAPVLAELLTQLKQYASVPDNSRDGLLSALVQGAALTVQEFADRAVVQTRLQLTATRGKSGTIRLYQGGGTIESVVDADTGTPVAYVIVGDESIRVPDFPKTMVVTYTTNPSEGDLVRLRPTLLRYATAVYDGATSEELNKILMETL